MNLIAAYSIVCSMVCHWYVTLGGSLAEELSCSAERIRQRLQELLDDGTLTRFGPMFDIEQLGAVHLLWQR